MRPVSVEQLLPLVIAAGLTFLFCSPHHVSGGDVKAKRELYLPDYHVYHNLSRIQSHLKTIAYKYPNYVRLDWVYQSREGRPQLLVRVTNFTDGWISSVANELPRPKVKILLSYGEHSREFVPIESLFHFLTNITDGLDAATGSSKQRYSRTITSSVDLFIVAMVNPDGRSYIEQTANYCWRGTSTGVDLNRNFDWHFGEKGSSHDKLDEEYRGPHVLSEPECLVLTDLTSKYSFDAFVSFHSGIRQIYVPFADSISKRFHRKPKNLESMLELADLLSHVTPNKFAYGMAYQLNEYTADGTIFDYMAGKKHIPFSLAIELWGEGDHAKAKCFDLFNPPSQELQKAVEDLHPIYETLLLYMIEWKQHQQMLASDLLNDAPSLTFGFVLLCLVIIITLCVAVHNRLPACLRLYPRRRVVSLRALSSTFTIMNIIP